MKFTQWRENDTYTQHLPNVTNTKIRNICLIFLSSIRALEKIAAILGSEKFTFHSMDDKVKVPTGITAAKKQNPLLMHMEY